MPIPGFSRTTTQIQELSRARKFFLPIPGLSNSWTFQDFQRPWQPCILVWKFTIISKICKILTSFNSIPFFPYITWMSAFIRNYILSSNWHVWFNNLCTRRWARAISCKAFAAHVINVFLSISSLLNHMQLDCSTLWTEDFDFTYPKEN